MLTPNYQEVWEPEERPFLMIIQPSLSPSTGEITARTSFLVPHFEAERVRLLGMPFADELIFIPWEEHWNPYSTLLSSWSYPPSPSPSPSTNSNFKKRDKPKVMVDDEMRDFIQRGLSSTGFSVVGLGGEVEKVKQIKTAREIEILRAVNTGTVEAVRAMRGCMYPGLREAEVKGVLDETLRAGGLEPFFDIVLFGMSFPSPTSLERGDR
jgi:Xaa-Pro aminopeptidase